MTSTDRIQSLVENIEANLRSASTTTAQTLQDLRSLLAIDTDRDSVDITLERPKSLIRTTKQASNPVKVARSTNRNTKKAQDFDICEAPEYANLSLPATKRRKIATNSFNATLKCLAAIVKEKRISATTNSSATNKSPKIKVTNTRPLAPCSPNRQAKRTIPTCTRPAKEEAVELVADCAAVALDCLRDLDVDSNKQRSSSVGQQEQGALVLLDKLVSLELVDHATTQATKVYEQYWKKRKDVTGCPILTKITQHSHISDHVHVHSVPEEKEDYNFLISYQSQMLRLATLYGPDVITYSFVQNISIRSSGSPASLVLRGKDLGFSDDEKTGTQLRTISLVLLKLYSKAVSDQNRSTVCSYLLLDLLVQSLVIKCSSWSHLQYNPDLERELWTSLLHGARRLVKARSSEHTKTFGKLQGHLDTIICALRTNRFDAVPSPDFVLLLSEVGEKAGNFKDILQMLDTCNKSKGKSVTAKTVIVLWQKAIIGYKSSPKGDAAALFCQEQALSSLRFQGRVEEHDIEDLLIYGARLRKSCLCIVLEIEDSLNKTCTDEVESQSQLCCAKFIIKFLAFLSEHFSVHLDGPASSTTHQSRKRSVITSFAKSVEAVLALERSKVSKTLLRDEYNEAVQQCIVLGHTLQSKVQCFPDGDALTIFVQGLPVRLSNLFWSRYTHGLGMGLDGAELTHCLIKSIAAVQHCTPNIQRTASLGMKLEKLALMYLHAKSIETTRQCFEDTISHYVQIGAAVDAVETALSKSSIRTWSTPGSKSYALGKALGSHGKLALTHHLVSSGSGMWFYDDESLPEMHQCVLLEEQLLSCLNQPSAMIDHGDAFKTCVRKILGLCRDSRYATYRARFILRLLKATADSSSSVVSQTLVDEDINQLVNSVSSEFLSRYHESTKYCLGIEWILWNGHNDTKALLQHVKSLGTILVGLPDADTLESSVDDTEFCFNQLRSVLSYARFIDNIDLAMQTLVALKQIIVIRLGQSDISLLPYLTQIGTLQNRAGNVVEAAKTFAAGQAVLTTCLEPSCAEIRWMLAYAEHCMDIGDISKVEETLKRAHAAFLTCYGTAEQLAGRRRLDRDALLSWAACIASRLAFQSGNLIESTRYAIQSFKISAAIWKAVGQPSTSPSDNPNLGNNDSTINLLGNEMSNLTLSSSNSTSQRQTRGSAFWNFAELHFESLTNLASIALHNGSCQDALQYGQLLEGLVQSIGSPAWELRAASFLAVVHGKAGHSDKAAALLEALHSHSDELSNLQKAEFCTLQVEALLDIGSIERATNLMSLLRQSSIVHEQTHDLKKPVKTATNGCDRAPIRGKPTTVRMIKKPAKHPAQRRPPVVDPVKIEGPQTVLSRRERFKDRLRMMRDMVYLAELERSDEFESGLEADLIPAIPHAIDAQITSSMVMLHKGLHGLASDPVKCVLAETAVALPVRYKSNSKSGRVTLLNVNDLPSASKARKTVRTKLAPKSAEVSILAATTGEKLLLRAQTVLQMMTSHQANLCPSDMLHVAGKIQSKLTLLSSTMNDPAKITSLQLVQQSASSKDIVLSRERLTIKAEKSNTEGDQVFVWPGTVSISVEEENEQNPDTHALSDIPESWSVISLSLAEDQQEMLVSKIVANKSPFLLRIPLSRPDIESEELDEFSFQEAISELRDIVTQANASCHDRRGQGNKQSRLEWYAERQALDKRLETLLRNIENIWLGGFRGLMTAERVSEEMLLRFGQNLSQILDQHLPSRQKLAKNLPAKVELHDHVLELFLGLGNPDEQEMDDAITDLLYFVIDILQFSGERNAYDEIDFDAILVEILDSLRSCHDLMQNELHPFPSHTILIVDKELASIPWESLPCMQTQSVSRMPSLSAVLERLKMIREQNVSEHGYSLSTVQSAYMLNPSSDLISTQSVFQPILQTHLPDYTAKINKAPTESEFEATLHENDLFLYFGHGAGAQYIRGRKIRSLDKCAVTLLMGCSSAKMTECGKFESYGMPGYYINGLSGCMAVVGTLWDVTDRDIDRFALRLIVEWGLVPEDELVSKALEKPRKKGQSKIAGGVINKDTSGGNESMRRKRGNIGLDEAVRRGREACALKYLNGAAPVVYGVPVFLG